MDVTMRCPGGNSIGTVSVATQVRVGVRVLVVDDYHPLADLLVGILWNAGYETRAAYSAAEALSAAEKFKPHAVVLDVILPDVHGFKFPAQFARRFPGCKMLLMSAWDFEHEPARALDRYRVVHKSVLMDQLFPFLEACRPSEEAEAIVNAS